VALSSLIPSPRTATGCARQNYVNASNVTTIGDFSKGSDFRLLGDLSNYGTVSAVSGSSNARSGAIRADDINNFKNATITSNVDLTLDASGTLNNAGTINSTGSLTVTAGGALNNSGAISAANNVDLGAATVNNRGAISSASGNVNLLGTPDAVLQVNNRRGTISALNGAINLRDSSYNGIAEFLHHGRRSVQQNIQHACWSRHRLHQC